MTFTIAHSPDSDDAYMMAPLALGWMDPEGFEIEFIRKDIEQLNAEATEGRYDVGQKLDFLRANIELALDRPDTGPQLAEFLRELVHRRGIV